MLGQGEIYLDADFRLICPSGIPIFCSTYMLRFDFLVPVCAPGATLVFRQTHALQICTFCLQDLIATVRKGQPIQQLSIKVRLMCQDIMTSQAMYDLARVQ